MKPKSSEETAIERYAAEGVTKDMLFGLASPPDDPGASGSPTPTSPPRGALSLMRLVEVVTNLLRPILPFTLGSVSAGDRARAEAQVDRALAQVDRTIVGIDRLLANTERSISSPAYFPTPYCSHGENYCTGSTHYTCLACGERDCCYMVVHFCPVNGPHRDSWGPFL